MVRGIFAFGLWALAFPAAAQTVAPEHILLNQIKRHMRAELVQVPNYTCLESVRRFHLEPEPKPRMLPLDSLHLEIVYSGGREWYALPGDSAFSEQNPGRFIGAGMIGDGLFAITLHNLFVADEALFTAQGTETIGGRKSVKYGFRLSRSVNQLKISLSEGEGVVGEEGSFWADAETLDLLRLDVHAIEIPAYLPLASMEFTVTYARTRIGELDSLLAQQAEMQMERTSGVQDYDRFDFTHCRTYHTASTIHFGEEPAASPGTPAKRPDVVAEIQLPALLAVTIQTTTPISDTDPVGKRIEGRITGDVRHKGKVLIADGTVVQGRLRRLERYQGGANYVVGLEFTDLETFEGPAHFYADLLSLDKRKDIHAQLEERVLTLSGPRNIEITLHELPGVASFFIDGSTFTLAPGFRTVWRTRGPLRGAQ